jgi:hypothetical protein
MWTKCSHSVFKVIVPLSVFPLVFRHREDRHIQLAFPTIGLRDN